MSQVGVELYVYYRLEPAQAEAARSAFEQARGAAPVRLLQRHELAASLLTWMEVYGADVAQADAVEQRVASAMAGLVSGPRHLERFETLPLRPAPP
ncbi:DUF4936 family protein [Paucibacter sp. XJ19-41]|uniref:DUF4936 family protein n=1 Tax=Paucibacter sp. XJ19-41 TaxID=2927824 RepID=UPI00234AA914|nr:DUF4936 family protein [Paucibacter sp. XJ19-41]MDC6171053.1 DUF4936 family protein [Paucibacter sp. XJ19-41]